MTTEPFKIDFSESKSVILNPVWADLLTSVVPVIFRATSDDALECIGTAFCIASFSSGQALFVTARHVVANLDGATGVDPMLLIPEDPRSPDLALSLMGVRIDQIAIADSFSDVALLRADLRTTARPTAGVMRGMRLGFNEAVAGRATLALGYSRQVTTSAMTFDRDLRASQGIVEGVHNEKRDSVLSTFPTFLTSGVFESGMSGGPVIAENGDVIGIVSHGMGTESDPHPAGYAASAGSLLEMRIDLKDDSGIEREFTMPELLSLGAVQFNLDPPLIMVV